MHSAASEIGVAWTLGLSGLQADGLELQQEGQMRLTKVGEVEEGWALRPAEIPGLRDQPG